MVAKVLRNAEAAFKAAVKVNINAYGAVHKAAKSQMDDLPGLTLAIGYE
jgi:hypothetical protein